MKNWIRAQMREERRQVTRTIIAAIAATAFMALLALGMALEPELAGLDRLDTRQKVAEFADAHYQQATLVYGAAVNMGGFTITSNARDTEYTVWKLFGDGYIALYCTSDAFANTGEAEVTLQHSEFTARTLDYFAPGDENAYVFYAAAPRFLVAGITAALFLLALLALWINTMARWDRRSHLGAQIAALGDYDALVDEISRQAEPIQADWRKRYAAKKPGSEPSASAQAALAQYGCAVLRDWVLLDLSANKLLNARMKLIPLTQLQDLRISPDEDDALMSKCEFFVRDAEEPHAIYLPSQIAAGLESLRGEMLGGRAIL